MAEHERPFSNEVVGLVPARGGSKSLPYKNIHPLAGRPLLHYVIRAAHASRSIDRVFCSTDDERIASVAQAAGAEIAWRPGGLATDEAPVSAAIQHFLRELAAADAKCPAAVALLQPTSPYVLPAHIDAAVDALMSDPQAQSVQTVTDLPHNHHAFNQREITDGYVRFRFEKERMSAYNKQRKPKLYAFGNLIVTRAAPLLENGNVFAAPSVAVKVPAPYAVDVDTGEDFAYAEWLLDSGQITLTHLQET
jgi:CMP-N,N'-diacetyllegionaminic acid synthase